MNIDYFLVEANRYKLMGYEKFSLEYILDLVNFIYGDCPHNSLINKYMKGCTVDTQGKRYYYLNLDIKTGRPKAYEIIKTQKHLATSWENPVVRQIYIMSLTNHAYKELAYIMFLLGMVNVGDYLNFNRDVDYVVSRISIKAPRKTPYGSKGVVISLKNYITLMGFYFKNALSGTQYGVNALDFVYNAYKTASKYSKDPLSYVYDGFSVALEVGISLPEISENMFKKYVSEIAIISGLTEISEELKSKLLDYFIKCGDIRNVFIDVVGKGGYISMNDKEAISGVIR